MGKSDGGGIRKTKGGGGEGREGENAFGYDNNRLTL